MKIKFFCPFLLCLLSIFGVNAQNVLKGVVADSANAPLPSASIRILGTTQGTSSDTEGQFSINYTPGSTLQVSALGYQTQEIPLNNQQTLTIQLAEDNQALSEVVVTALGIKRERRQLTYSTQEVGGEEILKTREPNVLNAMTGRVSGVQVTSSSGQPGSSSRIIVRGTSSLTGNNEALIVLDGVPINNSQTGESGDAPISGVSRLSDIDPEIIESINVLKGSAASALYGSAAARGVLLITTKNGGGFTRPAFNFTSQVSMETPIFPQLQSVYAQGDRGVYEDGETVKNSLIWGPRLDTLTVDGMPVRNVNPMQEFFQTGRTYTNSLGVQGGSDKSNYFLSYSYLDQEGTVPTTNYKRHSAFAKFNNNITDKLTANFQFNYVSSTSHRTAEGYGLESPLWTIYTAPFSWDPNPATDENGNQRVFRPSRNNPYWALDNIYSDVRNNRFIPVATFTYEPFNWLTVTERLGADIYSEQNKYYEAPSDALGTVGRLRDINTNFRQFNHDLIVEARKDFNEDFNASVMLGNNVLSNYTQNYMIDGSGLIIDGFQNISNVENQVPSEAYYLTRKVGFYGQGNLEYKRMLNLSLTGRIDQSSVFDAANRTYNYGSVSAGFIFTELLNIPRVDFGKVRISYSRVGNDNVAAYATTTPFIDNRWNNLPGYLYSDRLGNPLLTNEDTDEFEIGLETRFFGGRLGLEASYFDRQHKNLLSTIELAQSTGYNTTNLNAGSMYNKGVEALLTATPIRNASFSWDITLNFTRIRNKITALYEGQDMLSNGQTYLFVGDPYGTFYNTGYERNDAGQILIDDSGLPVVNQSVLQKIGNIQPDWLGGLNNSFTYKNFNFNFFFDVRKGGDVMNSDDRYGFFYGTPKVTENREDRIVEGVNINTGESNAVSVPAQDYYQRLNLIYEAAIQDGTYIKLRNVNLSYDFPQKWIDRTPFSKVTLTATGRNLWIHAPHFTGGDPEVNSFGTGNGSIGTFAYAVPASRSYNFSLAVTF
ncbi:SusC/RagA family TonB-linked outer membrane protein [Olivibacter sp. SDN3]|uniref:SusC/RagA family TonB-linked outer membrane protein n=1 Tax=Olivibacter sp. SDN3 TaxID=2764720 RepID=UPI0016516285|nr:SusC/RagA family TonB-linked outer membrane protein [Olivibacter sp. SDN3]QNL50752.1 SusC/RagA family TonB-linked outer membrane protein [Olivibacter sp. SDN3]